MTTTIAQCRPVQGFWDKSIVSRCSVNVYAFFIGNAVPNIVTDWALLILPIPYIWRLHQVRVQKIALCGVFMLGGLYVLVVHNIGCGLMLIGFTKYLHHFNRASLCHGDATLPYLI